MVTIGPAPETNGDKSLGDAEDSKDAHSCIMMGEEARGLLCSLAGMFKIHLSDSSIKVHVPEPLVYKRSKLYVYTNQRSWVHCFNLQILYSAMTREKGGV